MTLSLNWTQHLQLESHFLIVSTLFFSVILHRALHSILQNSPALSVAEEKKNLHNLSIENVNFQWELLLLTLIFWNVQQFSTAKKNCKSSVIFAFEKKKKTDLKMSFLNFWVLPFSPQKSLLVAEQFSNTNTNSHYLLNITKNHPKMFKNAKI